MNKLWQIYLPHFKLSLSSTRELRQRKKTIGRRITSY